MNKRKPIYLTDKQLRLILEGLDILFSDLGEPTNEDLEAREQIENKIYYELNQRGGNEEHFR